MNSISKSDVSNVRGSVRLTARRFAFAASTAALLALAGPAMAQLPSVRYDTGTLITPTAAATYYGGLPTSSTNGICDPIWSSTAACERLKEDLGLEDDAPKLGVLDLAAKGLGKGRPGTSIAPVEYVRNAYEYVHNFIEFTPTYGLTKGALGAMADRYGTAFDQADLLVRLLRLHEGISDGDVNFRSGTIRLTALEIQSWLGTQNAQATCYLLANGGIPGIIHITGSGDITGNCNVVPNTGVYEATLAHVWVEVDLGGTVYKLDPSFKQHAFTPGLNLQSEIMGSSSEAAFLTTALNGMSSTTLPAASTPDVVPAVRGILRTNIAAASASTLFATVEGMTNPSVEDVIGGRGEIVALVPPKTLPADTRPYTTGVDGPSWAAIPHGYRTVVLVDYADIYHPFYADEISGYNLSLDPYASPGPKLYIDGVEIHSSSVAVPGIAFTINHPYADQSGAYMDRTVSKPITAQSAESALGSTGINLIIALGDTDKARPDWERTMVSRSGLLHAYMDRRERLGHWRMRAVVATEWLALTTQLDRVFARVTGSVVQHHHSLGFMGTNARYHQMDVDSSISTAVVDDDSADARRGVNVALAAFRSKLEGHVVRGAVSAMSENSAAELVSALIDSSLLNENDVGGQRPYLFDVRNTSALTAAKDNVVDYLGGGHQTVAETLFTDYVNGGYRLIMPQRGAVYSWHGFLTGPLDGNDDQYPMFKKGAFIAISNDYKNVAHMVTSDEVGGHYIKGGAALRNANGGAGLPDLEMFLPELRNTKAPGLNAGVTVDPSSGQAMVDATDMVTGNGPFPYSLPFKRILSADDRGNPMNALPGGWKSFYDKRVSFVADPFAKLGYGRNTPGLAVVDAVVKMYLSTKLIQSSDTIGAIIVAEYIASKINLEQANVYIADTFEGPVRIHEAGLQRRPELDQVATVSTKFVEESSTLGTGIEYTRLTTKSGAEYHYRLDRRAITTTDGTACEVGPTIGSMARPDHNGLFFVRWPNGVTIKIPRSPDCKMPVTVVENNLGRKLAIQGTVTDLNAPYEVAEVLAGPGARSVTVAPTAVTLPDGEQITYVFEGTFNRFLKEVRLPTWQTGNPANLWLDYDDYYRVISQKDAEDRETKYAYTGIDTSARTEILTGITTGVLGYDAGAPPLAPPNIASATSFDTFGKQLRSVDGTGAETTRVYNALGLLVAERQPEGNLTAYTYDARHNLETVVRHPKPGFSAVGFDPTPLQETWDYDTTCTVDATGFGIGSAIPACDRPISYTDARGKVTTYAYDTNDDEVSYEDITIEPAGFGLVTTKTEPCPDDACVVTASVTNYEYNELGQPEKATDAEGVVTKYTFDETDNFNLTKVTVDPQADGLDLTYLALETEFVYDDIGNVRESFDQRDFVTTYEYDEMRRLTKVVEPWKTGEPTPDYTIFDYNDNGWVEEIERFNENDVLQQKTATSYFRDGQVRKTFGAECFNSAGGQSPMASGCAVTENFYDAAGRLVHVKDPDNRVTARDYDKAGRMTVLHSAVGVTGLQQQTTTTTYSANGQRRSAMDANGNRTQYRYDGFDRLFTVAYPSNKLCSTPTSCTVASPNDPDRVNPLDPESEFVDFERFWYDANDNLKTKRTRGEDWIVHAFDNMNREKSRDTWATAVGTGTHERGVVMVYRKASRLESVTENVASPSGLRVRYGYDDAGRRELEAVSEDNGTTERVIGYTLDVAGNTTAITWPDSPSLVAGYKYDAQNHVSVICKTELNGSGLCPGNAYYASYAYNDLGLRLSASIGDTRTATYDYWKDSALKELTQADLIDTDGPGPGTVLADAVWDFTYTKSNQMASKGQPSAFMWVPASFGATSYVANGLNQYKAIDAAPVLYDAQGNLTSNNGWNYTYDSENRLTQACDNADCGLATKNATYKYDGLDRRVSKTYNGSTTKYLWSGQNIIAEYDGSGTLLRRYIHGPAMDEPVAWEEYVGTDRTYYFHQDYLGTVVAVTDAAGLMVDAYTYSSYGEVGEEGTAASIWRYTGRQLDSETGLYYYRARMYDPRIGRFLQTDPAGDADSLNLYQYALWDPILNKDPTGALADIKVWDDGKVEVALPMAFSGDAATPANIADFSSSVSSTFSGQFGQYDVTTTVQSLSPEQVKSAPLYNEGKMTNGPTNSNGGHSFVKNGYEMNLTMKDVKGEAINGTVSAKGANTDDHEGGHLMGLPDVKGDGGNVMDEGGGRGVTEEDINTMIASPDNTVQHCVRSTGKCE